MSFGYSCFDEGADLSDDGNYETAKTRKEDPGVTGACFEYVRCVDKDEVAIYWKPK